MENKQGSTMGSEGVNKLTEVLQNRMRGMSEQPQVLDFGVIQPDMSLLTNKFPVPIPQSDYMVCRQLTLGPTNDIFAKTQDMGLPHSGSHLHKVNGPVGEATGPAPDPPIPSVKSAGEDSSDGLHQHHVLIPEKMRHIEPGDRVLVAWVGDDACVIDLILPATEV